jgi:hypothetical protein
MYSTFTRGPVEGQDVLRIRILMYDVSETFGRTRFRLYDSSTEVYDVVR